MDGWWLVRGRNSWEGRPREIKTIRVSQLPTKVREEFKRIVGKRRWTTEAELERLHTLQQFGRKHE